MAPPYAKYLGKTYPIHIEVVQDKPTLTFDGRQFVFKGPSSNLEAIEGSLQRFYQREAKQYIGKRLKYYQGAFKLKLRGYSIESHGDKWGSCSSQRHLTFHWYLMTKPPEAVDYVVVHELCHLEHLNHDRSFWRLVGKILPDYKAAKAQLGPEKSP